MINNATTDVAALAHTKAHKKWDPKKALQDLRRLRRLRADRWAMKVRPRTVTCARRITIKPEGQGKYDQGTWKNHRRMCLELARQEAEDTEVIAIQLSVWVHSECD
jgi:hypothetical protein